MVMVALVALGAAPTAAQAQLTRPHPAPMDDRTETARLTKLRYDASHQAYVVQATIALDALSVTKAERAKTSLHVRLVFERGGKTKRLDSTTKLSTVKIVSQAPRDGVATVQVTVAGPEADDVGAIRTDVELVGANPTPHP